LRCDDDPRVSPFVAKWRPTTFAFGVIESPIAVVVERFLASDSAGSLSASGHRLTFEEAFGRLLPLSSARQRRLFLATREDAWTVVVDNGITGTDVHALLTWYCSSFGAETIEAVYRPDTVDVKAGGWPGAIALYVNQPAAPGHKWHWLHDSRMIRLARDDAGRWEFGRSVDQEPWPFEQMDHYGARRVRDRFTLTMLLDYLEALGVRPFAESFYDVGAAALLVEHRGLAA